MNAVRRAYSILGVPVRPITLDQLHADVDRIIKQHQHRLILNVNAHCLNIAYAEPWLRALLNKAEIVFCDGAGVMLGARLLGYSIPERITYADWMWKLSEYAEPRRFSFFLLGAKPTVAEKAAARLRARHPNLIVSGTHHGYFDKGPSSKDNEAVIDQINSVKPNILIVGFGMPLQERWLMENWDQIDANIALTGGAVFDYISGELKRAPKWMTDNGLEWLGRLIIEPRRLWKRYIIGNPLFLWRVLKQRLGILKLK